MLLRKWEQHKTSKWVRSSYVSAYTYAYVAGVLTCYAYVMLVRYWEPAVTRASRRKFLSPREHRYMTLYHTWWKECTKHERWVDEMFSASKYFLLSNRRRSPSWWRPPKSGCRIYFSWVSSSSKCEIDSNQTWTILEPVLTVLPCQIKAQRARAI